MHLGLKMREGRRLTELEVIVGTQSNGDNGGIGSPIALDYIGAGNEQRSRNVDKVPPHLDGLLVKGKGRHGRKKGGCFDLVKQRCDGQV